MNEIMQQLDLLKETMALKTQLLESLSDSDLALNFGGKSLSLGELCKEMGEIQQMYIDSFKTLSMNWGYKYPDASVLNSLEALKTWYEKLDADLLKTLQAIKDEDVSTKLIDRGGFKPPLGMQCHIFREGLLIFCGKASIYTRALKKEMPAQFRAWIG